MTVVAIGRGSPGTFNLLLADTTVVAMVKSKQTTCERMKVSSFGDAQFSTVLGDEQVRDGLSALGAWFDPVQVDAADLGTATAAFQMGARYRQLVAALKVQLVQSLGTTLFIANRTEAFSWRASFDQKTNQYASPPKGPIDIPSGELWIYYGNPSPTRLTMPASGDGTLDEKADQMFDWAVSEIKKVHHATPTNRQIPMVRLAFGGAVIPHAPASAYRWKRPFSSLTDLLVRDNPDLHPQNSQGDPKALWRDAVFTSALAVTKLK
jgi:hypothetical protein